jgi:hypothetical protein
LQLTYQRRAVKSYKYEETVWKKRN